MPYRYLTGKVRDASGNSRVECYKQVFRIRFDGATLSDLCTHHSIYFVPGIIFFLSKEMCHRSYSTKDRSPPQTGFRIPAAFETLSRRRARQARHMAEARGVRLGVWMAFCWEQAPRKLSFPFIPLISRPPHLFFGPG